MRQTTDEGYYRSAPRRLRSRIQQAIRARRLQLEHLEARCLLAADAFCPHDTFADLESDQLFVNEAAPQYGSAVAQTAALSGSGGSTGSISGYKWNDLDGDRVWDQPDEPGLEGWIIYLDDNENGSLDNGETFTVTGSDGSYSFDGLAAGNYVVSELMLPGWSQTSPDSSTQNLIANGDFETGNLSGWTQQNTGSGTYSINNGTLNPPGPDGILPPYAGSYSALSTQTGVGTGVIYQDVVLPNFGNFSLLWTDQIRNHNFQFVDNSQEYRVEIRNTSNQVLATVFSTNPGDTLQQPWTERSADLSAYAGQSIRIAFVVQNSPNYFNVHLDNVRLLANVEVEPIYVTLADGEAVSGVNFGNWHPSGEIHGYKWHDINGDGVWNTPTEPGLEGWIIYLDGNSNGALDAGETWTTTEEDGSYSFSGLAPGNYLVSEVVQPGWEQTFPAVPSVANVIVNGGFETGSFSGWTHQNTGSFSFVINNGTLDPSSPDGALPVHSGNYSAVSNPSGAGVQTIYQDVTLSNGPSIELQWAQRIRNHYSAFVDPTQEFRVELRSTTNQLLQTLYSTNPGDPLLQDWQEQTADLSNYAGQLVRIAFVVSENLSFFNIHLDDIRITNGAEFSGIAVALGPNEIRNDVNFGNRMVVGAEIHGYKWNDVNGNGTWDQPDEPGLGGHIIYLDANANGALDYGEVSTMTASDGSYSFTNLPAGEYVVGEVPQPGWTQTSPGDSVFGTERLFALRTSGSVLTINELNPTTGAVINSFLAPATSGTTAQGLALGRNSLFFVEGTSTTTHTLWELNPNTGAVIDSDVFDTSLNGTVGGLAYLNGKVYVEKSTSNQIMVFDPQTDQIVTTLTVSADLAGGLTGAADLDVLFASNTGGTIYKIDPNSGTVLATISTLAGSLSGGLAYIGGELVGASTSSSGLARRIDPTTGNELGTITLSGTGGLGALAGDMAGLTFLTGEHLVTLDISEVVTDVNFGNWIAPPGEIHGINWNDVNGDTFLGIDEPVLPGRIIYLDDNHNGALDGGERWTVTEADGSYSFTDLPPGEYVVAELLPAGWTRSYPAGVPSQLQRFFSVQYVGSAMTIYELDPTTGAVLNSFAAPPAWVNGFQGLAVGPNSLFYLDDYNVSVGGTRKLWELDIDTGAVIDSDVVDFNWSGALAYLDGNVYIRNGVTDDIIVWDPVADTAVKTLNVTGVDIFNGLTGAGNLGLLFSAGSNRIFTIDPASGAVLNTFIYGFTVNGLAYVNGELIGSTSTRTTYRIDPMTGAILGTYTLPSAGNVGALGGDGAGPAGAHFVELLPGQIASEVDFASWVAPPIEVQGTVWNDDDNDGTWDQPEEPGLEGWTVYLDANFNNVLDPGEISTTSGTDGSYTLTGAAPGHYRVRQVLQSGWQATFAPPFVSLGPGETITGVNFGNYPLSGYISGQKWHDLDGDGVRESGEPGLDGWTIFIDENTNGVLDENEFSTETFSNGYYSFYVRPGEYTLAEVQQAGWVSTHTPGVITVGPGGDVDDVNFGNVAVQPLVGDYNRDESVDAADYVMWRKLLGAEVPRYEAADGDGDEVIGSGDHVVWASQFGNTSIEMGGGGAATVEQLHSEPTALVASTLVIESDKVNDETQSPVVYATNLDSARSVFDAASTRGLVRSVARESGDVRHEAALMAFLAAHFDEAAGASIGSLVVDRDASDGEVDDQSVDGVFADVGRGADWFSQPGRRRAAAVLR